MDINSKIKARLFVGSETLTLKDFKRIFDKLYPKLCSFSNTYTKDLEVSKDIVQEVFIKVWENRVSYFNDQSIKSFLYISVRNKSIDYLKSKYVKATSELTQADIDELSADQVLLKETVISETSLKIEEAINTLPKKCAQVIRLSIQDYSNAEIAKRMNLSVNTIKTQKKIAYKRLRPLLKGFLVLMALRLTLK